MVNQEPEVMDERDRQMLERFERDLLRNDERIETRLQALSAEIPGFSPGDIRIAALRSWLQERDSAEVLGYRRRYGNPLQPWLLSIARRLWPDRTPWAEVQRSYWRIGWKIDSTCSTPRERNQVESYYWMVLLWELCNEEGRDGEPISAADVLRYLETAERECPQYTHGR